MPLTLIGTSHISEESIKKVRKTIKEQQPDLVAVELDPRRLYALLNKPKQSFSIYNAFRVGFKGFIFAAIGSFVSKRLGKMVNVEPGEDMKSAVLEARKHKIKVALIDQDIEVTLRRFSAALTWKERWQFVKDIFNGIFFKEREIKKYGLDKFDLKKVPSEKLIVKMMKMVKDKYPSIYMVLVEERNHVMAARLKSLMVSNPELNIVAVVGAGHVEGMREILGTPEFSYTFTYDGQADQTV